MSPRARGKSSRKAKGFASRTLFILLLALIALGVHRRSIAAWPAQHAGDGAPGAPGSIALEIRADSSVRIGGEEIASLPDLDRRLDSLAASSTGESAEKLLVQVHADPDARHGVVVDLLTHLRSRGFVNVQLHALSSADPQSNAAPSISEPLALVLSQNGMTHQDRSPASELSAQRGGWLPGMPDPARARESLSAKALVDAWKVRLAQTDRLLEIAVLALLVLLLALAVLAKRWHREILYRCFLGSIVVHVTLFYWMSGVHPGSKPIELASSEALFQMPFLPAMESDLESELAEWVQAADLEAVEVVEEPPQAPPAGSPPAPREPTEAELLAQAALASALQELEVDQELAAAPEPASQLAEAAAPALEELADNEVASASSPPPPELGTPEGQADVIAHAQDESEQPASRSAEELMSDEELLESAKAEFGQERKGFATVFLAAPEDQLDIARFFGEEIVLVPRSILDEKNQEPMYYRLSKGSAQPERVAARPPLEIYRQYRDLFDYEYARLPAQLRELRRCVLGRSDVYLFAALIPTSEWALVVGRRAEALAASGRELTGVRRFVMRYARRPQGGFDVHVQEIEFADGTRFAPNRPLQGV